MKKFMFDKNDFDRKNVAPVAPSYSEEQLVLAKTQNYNQGKTDGLSEAKQAQEEFIIKLLQSVGEQAAQMIADAERREIESMKNAASLALRVAQKLMPQLAEEHAIAEIERVILSSIEERKEEPRIAITVPAQHLAALKARIDGLALQKGFSGKIILLADDAMKPSDCRVEWADGGAERIFERLYAQIETEFMKTIAGMDTTLAQIDEQHPEGDKE